MGDRLGTLGAVGLNLFVLASFFFPRKMTTDGGSGIQNYSSLKFLSNCYSKVVC